MGLKHGPAKIWKRVGFARCLSKKSQAMKGIRDALACGRASSSRRAFGAGIRPEHDQMCRFRLLTSHDPETPLDVASAMRPCTTDIGYPEISAAI